MASTFSSAMPVSSLPLIDTESAIHKAVDLHIERLLNSYAYILDAATISLNDGGVEETALQIFQQKLHLYNLLHSCRSLLQVAADVSVNSLLHDFPSRIFEVQEMRRWLSKEVSKRRGELLTSSLPISTPSFLSEGQAEKMNRNKELDKKEKNAMGEQAETSLQRIDTPEELTSEKPNDQEQINNSLALDCDSVLTLSILKRLGKVPTSTRLHSSSKLPTRSSLVHLGAETHGVTLASPSSSVASSAYTISLPASNSSKAVGTVDTSLPVSSTPRTAPNNPQALLSRVIPITHVQSDKSQSVTLLPDGRTVSVSNPHSQAPIPTSVIATNSPIRLTSKAASEAIRRAPQGQTKWQQPLQQTTQSQLQTQIQSQSQMRRQTHRQVTPQSLDKPVSSTLEQQQQQQVLQQRLQEQLVHLRHLQQQQLVGKLQQRGIMPNLQMQQHSQAMQQHSQTLPQHSQALQQHSQKLLQHSQPMQQHSQPMQQHSQPMQQHSQTLLQHSQSMPQHSQPLQQHSQPMQQHSQPMQQHSQPMQQHSQPMPQHSQTLPQHSQTLQKHSQPMQQHSQTLPQHSQPMQQHSQPIQQHSQAMQPHSQPMPQHSQPMQQHSQAMQPHSQPMPQHSQPMQQHSQPMQQHSRAMLQHHHEPLVDRKTSLRPQTRLGPPSHVSKESQVQPSLSPSSHPQFQQRSPVDPSESQPQSYIRQYPHTISQAQHSHHHPRAQNPPQTPLQQAIEHKSSLASQQQHAQHHLQAREESQYLQQAPVQRYQAVPPQHSSQQIPYGMHPHDSTQQLHGQSQLPQHYTTQHTVHPSQQQHTLAQQHQRHPRLQVASQHPHQQITAHSHHHQHHTQYQQHQQSQGTTNPSAMSTDMILAQLMATRNAQQTPNTPPTE